MSRNTVIVEIKLENVYECKATFTCVKNQSGQFSWRLVHQNSNQIGGSTETYTKRKDCLLNAVHILTGWFTEGNVMSLRQALEKAGFFKTQWL